MKQLTLRGIDSALDRKLKTEAQKRGLSINRTAIALLKESLGLLSSDTHKQATYDDLNYLSGTWSAKDAREFDRNLTHMRTIEKDVWE